LGAAEPGKKPSTWLVKYVDGLKHPIAVFNFRYRSRDDLKAERILPRSPTPVPLEDRPVEELTLEETRELLRRERVVNCS
jgi:hypothetical protein